MSKKTETVQSEVVNTEVAVAAVAVVEAPPAPPLPVAERLGSTFSRKAARDAMAAFWRVEGHKGLYFYKGGVKKGTLAGEGEVLANANGSTALMAYDEEANAALKDLIG